MNEIEGTLSFGFDRAGNWDFLFPRIIFKLSFSSNNRPLANFSSRPEISHKLRTFSFFWFQPQTCVPMLGINLLFGKSFSPFEQVFVHNSQFFHLIESFERVSKVLETGQTENVPPIQHGGIAERSDDNLWLFERSQKYVFSDIIQTKLLFSPRFHLLTVREGSWTVGGWGSKVINNF